MNVDIRNSFGMVPVEWRAIPHAFYGEESLMKIKTNVRAGLGSRNSGRCGGVGPIPLPHPVLKVA